MAHTIEPVDCPHCGKSIKTYDDVLTQTLIADMTLVACAGCRKILGVLPRHR